MLDEISSVKKNYFDLLYLFKTGKVSSGKAAEMLGVTKRKMLDIIYSEGIPYYDYDKNEVERELDSVS